MKFQKFNIASYKHNSNFLNAFNAMKITTMIKLIKFVLKLLKLIIVKFGNHKTSAKNVNLDLYSLIMTQLVRS